MCHSAYQRREHCHTWVRELSEEVLELPFVRWDQLGWMKSWRCIGWLTKGLAGGRGGPENMCAFVLTDSNLCRYFLKILDISNVRLSEWLISTRVTTEGPCSCWKSAEFLCDGLKLPRKPVGTVTKVRSLRCLTKSVSVILNCSATSLTRWCFLRLSENRNKLHQRWPENKCH